MDNLQKQTWHDRLLAAVWASAGAPAPPPRGAQALQTIGVALADHIIVADDDFVSMAQSGT